MEISIPDTVQFSMRAGNGNYVPLCFKHAVREAMGGTDIELELNDYGFVQCNHCQEEIEDGT